MVEVVLAILRLASELVSKIPELREAATTEDKARIDALYAEFRAQSNGVADQLRATPDDPEDA